MESLLLPRMLCPKGSWTQEKESQDRRVCFSLMSRTCLYNISYKKNYQIFTTTCCYGRHSAIVRHNTNFAIVHRQMTQTSTSVFSCCCLQNALYLFVQHHCRATPRVFEKIFRFSIVGLWSYLVPIFWVSSSLTATATLFYCEIWVKTLRVALQWVALALFKP